MFDEGGSYRKSLTVFGVLIAGLVGLNLVENKAMAMNLMSPAFKHGGQIPSKYTCEGDDVSPPQVANGTQRGRAGVLSHCRTLGARLLSPVKVLETGGNRDECSGHPEVQG